MSLFRRSLINKGVMTLENLMHVRASISLTKEEIDFSVKAIEETFREITQGEFLLEVPRR